MPALAASVAQAAADSLVTSSSDSSGGGGQKISALVDLFCCGGGFSLGAASALHTSLEYVVGVDKSLMVLRNYQHNVPKALAETATVHARERLAPTTIEQLRALVAPRALGIGTHVHMSPPCQAAVNGTAQEKRDLEKFLGLFFRLMVDAANAGCTCSLEEHRQVCNSALKWLAVQPEADRRLLYVYELSARDFGSPTGRERCVVTTFPLRLQIDRNPAHAA